jgi:hypothetical protein
MGVTSFKTKKGQVEFSEHFFNPLEIRINSFDLVEARYKDMLLRLFGAP